jgi:hypothetical protein
MRSLTTFAFLLLLALHGAAAAQSGPAETTITDIALVPAAEGGFELRATIRNTGGVPVRVQGRASIADEAGTELVAYGVEGEELAPGAEVGLSIGMWEPPGDFSGKVLATLRLAEPNTRASVTLEVAGGEARRSQEQAPGTGAAPTGDLTVEGDGTQASDDAAQQPQDGTGAPNPTPGDPDEGQESLDESAPDGSVTAAPSSGDGEDARGSAGITVLAVLLLLGVGGGLVAALRSGALDV